MKIGDLVKSTLDGVFWFGIITKEKSVLKTEAAWPYRQYYVTMYRVEWTFGHRGWFYPNVLEAV